MKTSDELPPVTGFRASVKILLTYVIVGPPVGAFFYIFCVTLPLVVYDPKLWLSQTSALFFFSLFVCYSVGGTAALFSGLSHVFLSRFFCSPFSRIFAVGIAGTIAQFVFVSLAPGPLKLVHFSVILPALPAGIIVAWLIEDMSSCPRRVDKNE